MKPQPVAVAADLIRFGDRVYFPTNPRYPGDYQVLSVITDKRDKDFRRIRMINTQPYALPEMVRLVIHKDSGVALTLYRK